MRVGSSSNDNLQLVCAVQSPDDVDLAREQPEASHRKRIPLALKFPLEDGFHSWALQHWRLHYLPS